MDDKNKVSRANSLWSIYVCGGLAACYTEIYTYPLDLVKTRLQIQGATADKIGGGPKRGMTTTAIGVIKEEGILALWNGIRAIWAKHIIYSGLRMVIYKKTKDSFQKSHPERQLVMWELVICGINGGFIGQIFASPVDVIKIQLQMDGKRKLMGLSPRVGGIWNALKEVYIIGGIKGLWLGWVPNVQRAILATVGNLTTYDMVKTKMKKHTNIPDAIVMHSIASIMAGFAAAVLSTPADVLKSRVMNQPLDTHGKGVFYKGTFHCFQKTIREEGVFALYKGFLPNWIRLGPWAIIYWISYEQLRVLIGGNTF